MAFAYNDMVDGFLDGISGNAYEHLTNAATFITEMPVSALDAVTGLAADDKEKLATIVRQASAIKASEFARTVFDGTAARREEIGRAVESLSISELAEVASTLVGLSSFEQQMSLNRETVGGPVDVAVISKGDGFIWIDRKHYFRKELNNHFFRNDYDDGVKRSEAISGGVTARMCEMANKQQQKPGGAEATIRGSGAYRSVNVRKLRQRAPQFSAFLDAVEGRERELSPSQRNFLDDFVAKLGEGAAEGDDAA